MEKAKKYLAIDLGASSGRGIIGQLDGNGLTLREVHRFHNGPVDIGGELYWDILALYRSIAESIEKCKGEDITSLGIDTWGVDYGIIDKYGHLKGNPRNYRDGRTDGITGYIEKEKGVPIRDIYLRTGIQSLNFNTLYQLCAELRDDPEAFSNGEKILFIPDLLNYFLTGVASTEYTIASTGALLDPVSHGLARDLLGRLGIPDNVFFGEPQAPGQVLGKVRSCVTGRESDISVVTIASHDTASAVMSVPSLDDEFVYISSGTWSLMGTELNAPVVGEQTLKHNYTNEGGASGTIRFLKNIMGLWIIQECRRIWLRENSSLSFAEICTLAQNETPFVSIIDPDDAIFAPPGDMPERIRSYCEKTGQPVPEGIGQIARCVFDSLALCYRSTLEQLCSLTGIKPKHIHIVGGGSQNALLCSLTASVTGLDVIAGPVEATAIGNIMSQAITDGAVGSLSEARRVVLESFETVTYKPQNIDGIECAYKRFSELISDKR